ncbi:MAG: hypothetical protein RR234_05960 [Christensenella sp.]
MMSEKDQERDFLMAGGYPTEKVVTIFSKEGKKLPEFKTENIDYVIYSTGNYADNTIYASKQTRSRDEISKVLDAFHNGAVYESTEQERVMSYLSEKSIMVIVFVALNNPQIASTILIAKFDDDYVFCMPNTNAELNYVEVPKEFVQELWDELEWKNYNPEPMP